MSTIAELNFKIGAIDNASSKIAKISKAVGSGLSAAAKIGAAAVGATATALGKMGLEAVKAYADYEQLVGGVETLFGAGGRHFKEFSEQTGLVGEEARKTYASLMRAQSTVMANAADAYKNAGLSANEYMETVTSFSASLIQSLGGDTAKAAQVSDMAITDMADNANKMGTSMESIQNAYQGFAKQNYTMLDNLKLGYGGTKQEMERLLADAQELSGVKYDISNLSDVYEAIHVIQTEMEISGITIDEANELIASGAMSAEEAYALLGTTAKEAASTISGSFGMLKASWKNFLTGLGDKNADIGKLTDQLVESAETLLDNLEPVVMQVLESLGGAVERLGPIIGEKLPGIIMTLLPSLIRGAMGLVGSLAQAVPEMLQMIFSAVDGAISESGFGERWASIKEAVSTAVEGIKEKWDQLKEKLQPLIDKVSEAWQKFKDWEEENHVLEKAIGLVGKAVEGVIDFVGDLGVAFSELWDDAEAAAAWVKEKWQPVATFFSNLAATIAGIFAADPGGSSWHSGGGFAGSSGGFAIGNDYVPYNGYPAILHRGEAVLTAREAEDWRQGNNGRGVQMVNNFYGVSQSDLDYIVAYVNRGLS